MDGFRLGRLAGISVLCSVFSACSARVSVERLPTARETLAAAGKRLSRSYSANELTTMATRGDRVLAALTREERAALGRSYLRFHTPRPVIVDVAVPARTAPFWLADQGFAMTGLTLSHPDAKMIVYRKSFETGWVGLGVNGLDRATGAHYAVFVRPAGAATLLLDAADPDRWQAVPAVEGVSAASDIEKPLQHLPTELRGSTLLRSAHGLRHSTLLARGRVWKTHVVSGREPDQIAIAFGREPARSLVWTWRTDPGHSATAIQVAPASPSGKGPAVSSRVQIVRGDSHLVETPDVLNDPTIRRHRVTVAGLKPDTAYAYALGDGTPGGWSPWRTVRTGPERPNHYSFFYLGDPQTGLEAWGKLLRDARLRRPDAGFLLIAGDLVDRGNERTNWDHFFLRAASVFEHLPLMPAIGNHEYLDDGPRLYRAFFDLPRNGPRGIDSNLVYSFEYADAFVAVLDSELALKNGGMAIRQAEWLDAALASTRATWKFVMFHHPLYASHQTRESPSLRAAWVPIFDKHHVDLVLQGHDHAYLRTYPLRASRRVESPDQGTIYLVSVSGDKYYSQRSSETTEVGLTNLSTYQTIDVQVPERQLTYRAWDASGREVDRFVISKPTESARLADLKARR